MYAWRSFLSMFRDWLLTTNFCFISYKTNKKLQIVAQ